MAKDELKNQVATRAETGIKPGQDTMQRVADLIRENMDVFREVIPKTVTPERLTRVALTTIKTTPKLMECSVPSLIGAIMQCARFGFEPNTTGECYIIPYKNQAQFQLGYIGHLQLLHRSGMVSSVGSTEVCEHDDADFPYGPGSKPVVKKTHDDRGDVIGYFAWIELRTGGYIWEYMTKKEIENHRDKFSKSYKFARNKNAETWTTNFDAMAKKTVLLRVMKYAPKSVEINEALFADNRITTDPMRLDEIETTVLPDEMLTAERVTDDAETIGEIDENTGELFEKKKERKAPSA